MTLEGRASTDDAKIFHTAYNVAPYKLVIQQSKRALRQDMESCGDSPKDAIKHINRSDEARAMCYEKISGLSWGDRHNFDLMVNSSVGFEKSADMICEYVLGREQAQNR